MDHFVRRFLRQALAQKERTVLIDFLHAQLGASTIQPGEKLEPALRELLYLVLGTPEYQLG
ncbi:MAG: hypothetical protein DMF97_14670 [Acidobacteria bacterium]|nr:MAG: hypothetical protein DMF97_14670 [Acidobacteriota bacterium]